MITRSLLLVISLLGIPSIANDSKIDMAYVDTTMLMLKKMFNSHEPKYLKKISSNEFIGTKTYQKLLDLVLNKNISYKYIKESVQQTFKVIDNKSGKYSFVIISFTRGSDRYWYVEDAKILNAKKEIRFSEEGFAPLAFDYFFSDLIREIESGNIEKFTGLAPHGKLNPAYLTGKKFLPLKESVYLVKNILVQDEEEKVDGFYYLRLKYQSFNDTKSGWIISEFDTMREYTLENSNDAYLLYLVSDNKSSMLDSLLATFGEAYSHFLSPAKEEKIIVIEKNDQKKERKKHDMESSLDKFFTIEKIFVPEFKWKNFFTLKIRHTGDFKVKNVDINKSLITLTFNSKIKGEVPNSNRNLKVKKKSEHSIEFTTIGYGIYNPNYLNADTDINEFTLKIESNSSSRDPK